MAKVRKVSNGRKPYQCDVCRKRFKTHQAGRAHHYAKHQPRQKCLSPHCERTYCNIDSLRRHVKKFHPNMWETKSGNRPAKGTLKLISAPTRTSERSVGTHEMRRQAGPSSIKFVSNRQALFASNSLKMGRPRGRAVSSSSDCAGESKIRTSTRGRKELVTTYVEDSLSESDTEERDEDPGSDFAEYLSEAPLEGESSVSEYGENKKGKATVSPKKSSAGGRGRGKKVSPRVKPKAAPKARGRPHKKPTTAASKVKFNLGRTFKLKSFALDVERVECPDCGRHFKNVKSYFQHRRAPYKDDLPLAELNIERDPCMGPSEYKVIAVDELLDSNMADHPTGEESESISKAAPQGDSLSVNGNGAPNTSSKLSALAARYADVVCNWQLQQSQETKPVAAEENTLEEIANSTPSFLEIDQAIVDCNLAAYVQLSQKLGAEVAEHAALVRKAFDAQRSFLAVATAHAKPSEPEFQKLLTDTANAINEIRQFREKRRGSPLFNHLSAVSESIRALEWVEKCPTPGPHVQRLIGAGQFYTNRVLQDFKQEFHSDWAESWTALLSSLLVYVRRSHTFGLVWGGKPYP